MLPYKTRDRELSEVGRQLGVRYLLDGSMRRSAAHFRITVDLIKVEQAETVWGEQYDITCGEFFDVQDTITRMIVGQLDPKLRIVEIERCSVSHRSSSMRMTAYCELLR